MFDFLKSRRPSGESSATKNRSQNAAPEAFGEAEIRALFDRCADLQCRCIHMGGNAAAPAWVFWLDGMVSADAVSEEILRPLSGRPELARAPDGQARLALILGGAVYSCASQLRRSARETADDLTQGRTAVLLAGAAVTFETRSNARRDVSEPTLEKSALGPKDSFTETFRTNTALVRRRLRTPSLKLEERTLGRLSGTKTAIFYLENRTPPGLVEAVLEKLDGLDVESITGLGDIAEELAPPVRGMFPQLIYTERPDRFSMELLSGRVGLIMDGLPQGLLLPCTLPDMLRAAEARSLHAVPASALIVLRWAGLLLSLLLPALYVAVAMYHQEMIPYQLLQSIIAAKQRVPFSTAAEIVGMLAAFGLLQEAGLRLPDAAGTTVSIIGTLIVGQSAVEARVVSPIAVIVVALSGIAGYTQPNQHLSAAMRLWRFVLVVCALLLGVYGVMAGLLVLLWRLCSMECAGVCYLYPLADGKRLRLLRTLLRLPRRFQPAAEGKEKSP